MLRKKRNKQKIYGTVAVIYESFPMILTPLHNAEAVIRICVKIYTFKDRSNSQCIFKNSVDFEKYL